MIHDSRESEEQVFKRLFDCLQKGEEVSNKDIVNSVFQAVSHSESTFSIATRLSVLWESIGEILSAIDVFWPEKNDYYCY